MNIQKLVIKSLNSRFTNKLRSWAGKIKD